MSSSSNTDLAQFPLQYKGWIINVKEIKGQLWLRWQHPQESFFRYGTLVPEAGVLSTIGHVRLLINISIELEKRESKDG